MSPTLMRDDAQHVHRIGMPRLPLQNPFIQSFSLAKLAAPMKLNRL
jgi:hypothetical protein